MKQFLMKLSLILLFLISESTNAESKTLDLSKAPFMSIIDVKSLDESQYFNVVKLKGIIKFEIEGNVLFVDRFSYEENIIPNGIALSFADFDPSSLTKYNGSVATVWGIRLETPTLGVMKVELKDRTTLIFFTEDGQTKIKTVQIHKS